MGYLSCLMPSPPTRSRLRNTVLQVIVLSLPLGVACISSDESGPPTRERCIKLRDHLVELRLAQTSVDVDAHRDILRRSMGEEFMTTCAALPPAELRCTSEAKDLSAAIACSDATVR